MSFCIQCGAALKTGVHFCPACGAAALHSATEVAPSLSEATRTASPVLRAQNSRPWGIIGAVGCVGLGLLGVIALLLLYSFGNRKPAPPAPPQSVTTASVPPEVPEIAFRTVSHPNDRLIYEIPSHWEETGGAGEFRTAPPAGHPDANAAWVRTKSIPRKKRGADKQLADALGSWLTSLSGLQIDETYPVVTRPNGEVVTDADSVAKDEVLLFSTVVTFHFTDPNSGKRWRGLFSASEQADGRGDFSYLLGVASLEERWLDFQPVFVRLLGAKIGLKPK